MIAALSFCLRFSRRLVGKQLWSIPLIIAALTFLLSAAGCGNIPMFAILLPLSLALADELEIDVIAMGLIVTMACNLGVCHRFPMEGSSLRG